jgi:uncharacterized protein YndB with AHSA1/START domain
MPWTVEYSGTCRAEPARVYEILSAPERWHEWNAGVRRVEMNGPFAAGTTAVMVLPDGTELPFRFIHVEHDSGFTDETPVPDTGVVVRVHHELTPVPGGTSITYRCEADGPPEAAAEVGAQVSADFPDVIAALVARAEDTPNT